MNEYPTSKKTKVIYIVSDGSGETAEKVAHATLLQFVNADVQLKTCARVLSTQDIDELVNQATLDEAFILYTVIHTENREYLRQKATEKGLDSADLIGSLVLKLSHFLQQKPLLVAGLGQRLDEDYFRRVDAIEFSVKNDDGQEPRNLYKADMILVGLSRTSKTPLSIYLAHKGYKVANVPLVKGIVPPQELFKIPQHRIYALIINSQALVAIRQERLKYLGLPQDSLYADADNVEEEIKWVRTLYSQNPHWPVFDVSNRAIEETATAILKIHEQQKNE